MYCGVNEAYTNNNDNHLGGFDNYSDIDIHNHFSDNYKQYNDIIPAYFTAQGDMSSKRGTSITDLKHKTADSDSILSDSDFSIDSAKSTYDTDNSSLFSLKTLESSKSHKSKCPNNIPKVSKDVGQIETFKEYFDTKNLGYTVKELLIIILAGIILIFILDLLVRIGKKMNRN